MVFRAEDPLKYFSFNAHIPNIVPIVPIRKCRLIEPYWSWRLTCGGAQKEEGIDYRAYIKNGQQCYILGLIMRRMFTENQLLADCVHGLHILIKSPV